MRELERDLSDAAAPDADDWTAATGGHRSRQGGAVDRHGGRGRGHTHRACRSRTGSRRLPAGGGGPAVRARRRDHRCLRDDRGCGAAASLRRARERRHNPRRPGAGTRAWRRDLLPPSAPDDPRRRRRPDRSAVRHFRLERGRPSRCGAARRAPRQCAPSRCPRNGAPPTTPRPRSPRTCWSPSRNRPSSCSTGSASRIARELLAPLVLRTAANWAERGPRALTGPIARGDAATVARHRAALREIAPELLPLYEALAARAHELARTGTEAPA